MDFDQRLLYDFTVDSRDHLTRMDHLLADLPAEGDRTICHRSLLQVFRCMHSVKGTAGFLGLRKICGFAHALETLLEVLCDRQERPNQEVVDTLMFGVDLLRTMFDDVDSSEEVDTQAARAALSRLMSQRCTSEELTDQARTYIFSGDDGVKYELDGMALERWVRDDFQAYMITVDIGDKRRVASPVALLGRLLEYGELADGHLVTSVCDLRTPLQSSALVYQALFGSRRPKKVLDMVFLSMGVYFVEVPLPQPVRHESGDGVEKAAEAMSLCRSNKEYDTSETGQTIRVSVHHLEHLTDLAQKLSEINNWMQLHCESEHGAGYPVAARLNALSVALHDAVWLCRLQPVAELFHSLKGVVRQCARHLNKEIELQITPSEIQIDKGLYAPLFDALAHIVRNACVHGIEWPEERRRLGKPDTGTVRLSIDICEGALSLTASDDGRGVQKDTIAAKAVAAGLIQDDGRNHILEGGWKDLIQHAGFSTLSESGELAGRGMGLNAVAEQLRALDGSVDMESMDDLGLSVHLRLPSTVWSLPCCIFVCSGVKYAIAHIAVLDILSAEQMDHSGCITFEEKRIRHLKMTDWLAGDQDTYALADACETEHGLFLVLMAGEQLLGLEVDDIIGREELVVRPIPSTVPCAGQYLGAGLLHDMTRVLICDEKKMCVES